MKSFADWTDEIRALMNPPTPAADAASWPDTVGWRYKKMSVEDFHKQYADTARTERWQEGVAISLAKYKPDGMSALEFGVAVHARTEAMFRAARRTGKQGLASVYAEWMRHNIEQCVTPGFVDGVLYGTSATRVTYDEHADEPIKFENVDIWKAP